MASIEENIEKTASNRDSKSRSHGSSNGFLKKKTGTFDLVFALSSPFYFHCSAYENIIT